ncbi:hypothetical protein IC762_05775 [Bradyrhizobium genosp. L]|uniref:hypothetical protein n=1 Tax=Bradyrhizobium genosp. L TaxID=83637 RepID=UPI0018A2F27E|nr:hypothetical protein [Bradyrhizobium genosp. L]QPF85816.1 hypothetical protein IC762_05775 [Bradyrhizobium genosp. L]
MAGANANRTINPCRRGSFETQIISTEGIFPGPRRPRIRMHMLCQAGPNRTAENADAHLERRHEAEATEQCAALTALRRFGS